MKKFVDWKMTFSHEDKKVQSWGYEVPPDNVDKNYTIKSAYVVQTWEEVLQALANGYPISEYKKNNRRFLRRSRS